MIDTDKYALVIDDDGYFCEDKIADLLTQVKRLRKQLVAYTDFVLWVEEKHNEVFDEYERKDEL